MKKSAKNDPMRPSRSTKAVIGDLPDIVLTSIFALLPMKQRVRIERVSKRWRRLAKSHAWTSFDSLCLHFDESLPVLKDFHGNSVSPEDDGYGAAIHDWLYSILERCGPYLREIDFVDVTMQLETFALLGLAPNVKHFGVAGKDSEDGLPLSDAMLEEIGSSLGPRLKAIHFDGVKITDTHIRDFGRFAEKCPSLECLSIWDCASMEPEELFADGIDDVAFPSLKVLELDLSFHVLPLLAAVAEKASQLASFTLWGDAELHPFFESGSEELMSRRIVEIISKMKSLKHLAVDTGYIRSEHVLKLLKTDDMGRRLESLHLHVETRELLDHVMAECPNVLHLTLDFCERFDGPFAIPATGLKKLRFLYLDGEVPCGMLTAIAESAKRLEFVDVSMSESLQEPEIIKEATRKFAMELRRLIRDSPTLKHVHMGTSDGYTMIRLGVEERLRAERSSGKWPLSTLQVCLEKVPSHLPQHSHIRLAEWSEKEHETEKTAKEAEGDGRPTVRVRKCQMPELYTIIYGKSLSRRLPTFLGYHDCTCEFC